METDILDEILNYLLYVQKQPKPYQVGKDKIDQSFMKYEKGFFKAAVNKLIKEGYVIMLKNVNEQVISQKYVAGLFDITFDGIIFIINGGYHAQQRRIERDNNNFQELQVRQDALAKSTFRLTVVIAIGTSIAGVYYFLYILDFFGILKASTN